MSVFTNIGIGLWSWEPFRRLERSYDDIVGRCSKLFWIALYTTPEAKMAVPGMFSGSIATMADAARIPADDARAYLSRLLEDELVEYDVDRRVLRMTMLPDCGESPSNGKAIRGWWRRFQTVPECAVRDAHVSVLRWIIDEWCRRNQKALSNDHANAWAETFGRISVPSPKHRRPRHVQTDLFSPPVDNSSADPKNRYLDTNTIPTRLVQDPDPRSMIHDLSDQGGGSGGGKKLLTLVPPASGFDADDLAETLATATGDKFPRALTRPQRQAIAHAIGAAQDAIKAAGETFVGADVLAVLGDYVKHGAPGLIPANRDHLSAEERLQISKGISPALVASPGWLSVAIQKAIEWAVMVAEKRSMISAEWRS